jgi:hypothetical protein
MNGLLPAHIGQEMTSLQFKEICITCDNVWTLCIDIGETELHVHRATQQWNFTPTFGFPNIRSETVNINGSWSPPPPGLALRTFADATVCALKQTKQTLWPESSSELYRPSDRRLSAKLELTFADRGVSRSQRDGSLQP